MRTGCFRLSAILLAGSLLAGCDRNTEPFVPGEKPRAPDLARIFPESDPAAKPPAATGGLASPPTGTRGNVPPTGGRTEVGIRGRIEVAPALEGDVPVGGLLFVIARAKGVTAGPPLAVLRIPGPSFPLDFRIGPENVMIPSLRFAGEIQITARLDSDGNAMTKQAGDLAGAAENTHAPGASGVRIVLDEKI